MTVEKIVSFGSVRIPVLLQWRDRKNITIKVHPDCRVEAIAPVNVAEKVVLDLVRTKAPWIIRQLTELASYQPLAAPRRYVNGATHRYLGRQYRLHTTSSLKTEIKVYPGKIRVSLPAHGDPARVLHSWYRKKAVEVFENLLVEVLPLFKQYKIAPPVIKVRSMKKRWGSCTPSGLITLNTELVQAHKSCIEYVIVHELCHLVHFQHDKAFYTLLTRLLPDWQQRKRRLEQTLA